MLPALSQVCSLNSPFDKDIEDYAAGQCRAVELWLGKLETYLEHHSLEDVRALLAAQEMATPVASFQGGLFVREIEAREEHWRHFGERLKLCAALGVETLVITADFPHGLDQEALDGAQTVLTEAGKLAGEHGLRLALEFQARSPFANNLQTAAAIVAECASPAVGICFDVFHYYLGPSKAEDWAYLTPQNLFHVQLSDLPGIPREFASDSDRVLPGDGDFQLAPFIDHLREIDYQGAVSIELMNPQIWQVPARSFGEIAMTALRKVLGLASME